MLALVVFNLPCAFLPWCLWGANAMRDLTEEELKAIIKNAPFENIGEDIFINALGNYILFYEDDFYTRDNNKWVKCRGFLPCYGLRSLSEMKRIIEQREMLELAWSAIQEAGYEDFCSELRNYIEG